MPVENVSTPADNPRRRLLIAEDDANTMFPLRDFFCSKGFTVDCVLGPIEASRMLERFSYAVLLTDLHLTPYRRKEGLEILRQARRRQPGIRAIMMTAFPSPEITDDALRVGADALLAKPIRLESLNAVVGGAVPTPSTPGCRTS